MSSIATALKAEIARVARKELKVELQTMRKASAGYRREIAALKKRVHTLERQVKHSGARQTQVKSEPSSQEQGRQLRFSATRFAAQRQKLGLSAANFAKLLGVSAPSVYKWESGQTRPRRAQIEAIAAARRLGKREALARLEQAAG